MWRLTNVGIHVTWVRGGEFDAVGALRVAQGFTVIVPSGDADMFAYPLPSPECDGKFLVPGDVSGDFRVCDTAHKIGVLTDSWDVSQAVAERHYFALQLCTLAVTLNI